MRLKGWMKRKKSFIWENKGYIRRFLRQILYLEENPKEIQITEDLLPPMATRLFL